MQRVCPPGKMGRAISQSTDTAFPLPPTGAQRHWPAAALSAAPGVLSRHRCRCIRGRKPSIKAYDTRPLLKNCERQWPPAAAFLFGRAGQKIQAFS